MAPQKSFNRSLAEILLCFEAQKLQHDEAYLKIAELNKIAFDQKVDFYFEPSNLLEGQEKIDG